MRDIVQEAADFAIKAHGDQKRKYTGQPYYVHLDEVGNILYDADMPEIVVAAGYLHDTLEDTGTTKEEIAEQFGPLVAGFVEEVTDVSKPEDGNRAARKAIDLKHLAQSSPAGAAIKLADLISNAKDIVEHDPSFARVYLQEKLELLRVLDHGPPELYKRAMITLAECLMQLMEKDKAP